MYHKNKMIYRAILQICLCIIFLFSIYFMAQGAAAEQITQVAANEDVPSEEAEEEQPKPEAPAKEEQIAPPAKDIPLEEAQDEEPEILLEEEREENQSEDFEEESKDLPETTKRSAEALRNWTNYNGIIFGNASIYEATFGGGLAVSGNLSVYRDFTVGSTYTSEYDATLHIGEYRNEEGLPTLLFGGNQLHIENSVRALEVYGGAITMSPDMLEYNQGLEYGFNARTGSEYQSMEQTELDNWFARQYQLVSNTSKNLAQGNDVSIELEELSSGSYQSRGAKYFENQFFEVNGEVNQSVLLITVRTGNDVDFGNWWPEFALIVVDADWARAYDLVVFNFPDAVNVTMNANAFQYYNVSYWSTTVDAWIGEEGRAQRQALSEKVVYNFPSASSIEATHAFIQGSILAPDATFTGVGRGSDGHIYGHIIARNLVLQNNFNLHAFPLTDLVHTLVSGGTAGKGKTGAIELRQYLYFRDRPSNIRLGGGEYVLVDKQGQYYSGAGQFVDQIDDAQIYMTQSSGNAVIDQVPYGEYTLRCIGLPENLSLNKTDKENSLTYFEMAVSLREEEKRVSVAHYSEPRQSAFYFRKTDSITGAGVEDAVFAMVREADEYEDATLGNYYSSGEDGGFVSHNLAVGSYRLVEVEIPDGYSPLENGEFRFQVYWDETEKQLKIRSMEGESLGGTGDNPVQIDNPPGTNSGILTVVKYAYSERESGAFYVLPGAEFDLYHWNGAAGWIKEAENAAGEAIKIVTGDLGYTRVENMNRGLFRLVERKAPDGYQVSNQFVDEANPDIFPDGYAHEFEIREENLSETAYIVNAAWSIDITVFLQSDVLSETISLGGAAFRLDHLLQEENTWEEIFYRGYTDEEGKMVMEGLKEGTYRLTQIRSATGYHPLDPAVITFIVDFQEDGKASVEVNYNGDMVERDSEPVSFNPQAGFLMTIQNTARTRGLTVYKIDADYQLEQTESGQNNYRIQYLEGAQFRLRRRVLAASGWKDYGSAFTSKFAYDEKGNPILDGSGNHVTKAFPEEGLLYGDYQLVEVKAPIGYSSAGGVEVMFEDGQKGRLIHSFTVTENMTGVGSYSEYVASDYAIVHDTDLTFQKVDKGDWTRTIEGAKLALYTCTQDHLHDETADPGACWNNQAPVITTSDKDGMVTFQGLVGGSYLLAEVKVPDGYQLAKEQWLISVDPKNDSFDMKQTDGSEPTLITDGPEAGVYLLMNQRRLGLPFTGAGGRRLYMLLAAAFLGMAVIVYVVKSKRKESEKDEDNKRA